MHGPAAGAFYKVQDGFADNSGLRHNFRIVMAEADRSFLLSLVQDERVVGVVVGLPVHLSGDESQKSQEARSFAAWVAELTGLPVRLFDERFSSAGADALLGTAGLTKKRRQQRRDMLAAQIILASYLESSRTVDAPPDALED